MEIKHKIIAIINSNAQSNSAKKVFLTVITGIFFILFTTAFVIIPLYIDKTFSFSIIPDRIFNFIISFPFIFSGSVLVLWCDILFLYGKGTPVPLTPPKILIEKGPYAFSRNPMTTGLFLLMFGIGFYFGSLLSIFIFTPLYILIHYFVLKNIEEPELEKRLGEDYINYKKKVPMFIPGIFNSKEHRIRE